MPASNKEPFRVGFFFCFLLRRIAWEEGEREGRRQVGSGGGRGGAAAAVDF